MAKGMTNASMTAEMKIVGPTAEDFEAIPEGAKWDLVWSENTSISFSFAFITGRGPLDTIGIPVCGTQYFRQKGNYPSYNRTYNLMNIATESNNKVVSMSFTQILSSGGTSVTSTNVASFSDNTTLYIYS